MIPAIISIAVLLFAIALGVFIYTTLAVNAEADREQSIVSVPFVEHDPAAFMRALAGAAGHHVFDGNAITLYQNGVEIFPALLEGIASAKASVNFSTFIYEVGDIPTQFANAFADAARRGVEVRVVLDGRGSKTILPELIGMMKAAGCKVVWFRVIRWNTWAKYNHRNHRKLLIVDGTVAFTGGVGIADEWGGNGDSPEHWRDSHVRVLGPSVAAVQAAFVDNWNAATGELPVGDAFFPLLPVAGNTQVSAVQSNPANGTSAAQRSMAVLIAGATKRLWITNAYFIPSPPFVRALCAAKARGVDVKILVPGRYLDEPPVRWASRRTWRPLLKGGVELLEFQRTMIHGKIVIVDSLVSSIGSINFDARSFALNAEFGIVALDAGLARQFEDAFTDDLRSARRVVFEDLDHLSIGTRLVDAVCYWIRAQL
ncbi:MAG: phospholipase D-like domain-containing protein [Gemmatimonadaceae bacterium]